MKQYQTWKCNFNDGMNVCFWCKKSEILDNLTARQFVKLVSVEIINRYDDKTQHKALSKEDLI